MKLAYEAASLESHAVWDQRIYGNGWTPNRYKDREKHCVEKGWFILTEETGKALYQFLSKFNSVVEPFAGTGYLAHHMRRMGMGRRYRAYDACVTHWQDADRPRRNYGFTKSGCFNINLKKAEAVVMTWPNYAESLAYRIARKMVKGQYLIYQGEGRGGCTGDDRFHDYLETDFTRLELREKMLNHKHVNFDGIHDKWHVYIKN